MNNASNAHPRMQGGVFQVQLVQQITAGEMRWLKVDHHLSRRDLLGDTDLERSEMDSTPDKSDVLLTLSTLLNRRQKPVLDGGGVSVPGGHDDSTD